MPKHTILDQDNTLSDYLAKVKNSQIDIISAFGSNTSGLLEAMLKNNNSVSVLVGTINHFTRPDFIRDCRALTKKNTLQLRVDFRIENSIHWKIYLVSPSTVVVGSANFTAKGVSLAADTCVVIDDEDLYQAYFKKYCGLISIPEILSSESKAFDKTFKKYEDDYVTSQARSVGQRTYKTLEQWLSDESNDVIPLFIWDHPLSAKEKSNGKKTAGRIEKESGLKIEPYGTYETKPPFKEGDLVLCMKNNGARSAFVRFIRIEFDKSDKLYYFFSTPKSREPAPFNLKLLKSSFKKYAPKWFENEIEFLYAKDLYQLLPVRDKMKFKI